MLLLALAVVLPLGAANTPGVFRGVVVENPQGEASTSFIFLRARTGSVRKVEMSKAVIAYDETVPKEQQGQNPSAALKPGADVRVTAEQESDGEWHASRIDILGNDASQKSVDTTDDDDDDSDMYSLQPYGSTRPVLRKS